MACSVSFVERCLGGIYQAADIVFLVAHGRTVYHEEDVVGGNVFCFIKKVFDACELSFDHDAGIAFLDIHLQLFAEAASLHHVDGGEHNKLGTFGVLTGAFENVLGGMAFHLLTTDGGVGLSDAGEQQTEIFVNLGAGAYGGTRVAGNHFLLDGDGWRQPLDEVTLGFAHAPQKLAGIGRQRLYVATLPLGIECVESQ